MRLLGLVVLAACPARVVPVGTGWSNPLPPRMSSSVSVVQDAASLREVGGRAAVDFVLHQVIVLQAPTRHSRSRISVRAVDVADGVVMIDACVRGSMVQTLSAPWVAVTVPVGVREVRWICGDDLHATATARR